MNVAPAVVDALNLNPFESISIVFDDPSAFDEFGIKFFETTLKESRDPSNICQSAIPVDLYKINFGKNPQYTNGPSALAMPVNDPNLE